MDTADDFRFGALRKNCTSCIVGVDDFYAVMQTADGSYQPDSK
jgi:hypothetical protein